MTPADEVTLLFGFDFYSFWAAGNAALAAQNVYDPTLIQLFQYQAGWPNSWPTHTIPYPPWTILFFIPFAVFPFHSALLLWTLVAAVSTLFAAQIFYQVDPQSQQVNQKRTKTLTQVIIALLLFVPLFRLLILGQSTWILLTGITLFYIFIKRNNNLISGLFLSLVITKPQLCLPFVLAVLFWAIHSGRKNIVYGFILGASSMVICAELVIKDSLYNYLEFISSYYTQYQNYPTHALSNLLAEYFDNQFLRPLITIIGLISAIAVLRYPFSILQILLIYLPVSLLSTPYSWVHDSILLLPTHMILYYNNSHLYKLLIFISFVVFYFFLPQSRSELFACILPSVIFVFALAHYIGFYSSIRGGSCGNSI